MHLLRRAWICLPLALGMTAVALPQSPASAELCAQVGVSTDGTDPTPVGPCEPSISPFGVSQCTGGTLSWENLRVTDRVCVPRV